MGFANLASALLLLVAISWVGGPAEAQTVLYDAPVNKWVTTFLPMLDNNGLVWAPDDLRLYATSIDGTVAALDPDNGTIAWTFQPTGDGTIPFSCNGEASFAADGSSVIYAVTEGDVCKVHALSHPFGDLLWSSPELEGVCEGTPYYTSDGAYVFVIHNSNDGLAGHFSVLDVAADASVLYQYTQTNPFAQFGFSRDVFPGGNYGAGSGNINDLAVWGYKPTPGATFGEDGSTFAFQMPPPTSIAGPFVTTLLNMTSWRHTAAPLLTARAQQLYWLISRSKVRAWINNRFSSGADGEADFGRGTPIFKAAPYTPVVDDMENPTLMCGGPADESFACLSTLNVTNGTMTELWSQSLGTGLVFGNPLMSTGGDRVYWVDSAGIVQAADPLTGAGAWTSATDVAFQANPTLSSDGARLFFADMGGIINAWEVAEGTLPPVTLPPRDTAAPTGAASVQVPTIVQSSSPSVLGAGGSESVAPSTDVDTTMPSLGASMPVLTASPVMRPLPTSNTCMLAVMLCTFFSGIVLTVFLL
jgi:outer membrane protein assembly factor BamB